MSAPQLPTHVSNDGREIWDWAAQFSEYTHRRSRISNLKTRIAEVGCSCGDCYKWMKSRECPRETNVNGYSRGPSMKDRICTQFVEDRLASDRREKLKAELAGEETEMAKRHPAKGGSVAR